MQSSQTKHGVSEVGARNYAYCLVSVANVVCAALHRHLEGLVLLGHCKLASEKHKCPSLYNSKVRHRIMSPESQANLTKQ